MPIRVIAGFDMFKAGSHPQYHGSPLGDDDYFLHRILSLKSLSSCIIVKSLVGGQRDRGIEYHVFLSICQLKKGTKIQIINGPFKIHRISR